MKRLRKTLIAVALAILLLIPLGTLSGCEANRHFTNEEHIERISERVQARFFAEGADYPFEDFTVTILYSLAGYPDFFMVEFEPYGVFYGIIFRNEYYGLISFGGISMRRSAFYIAGVTDERRYLYREIFGGKTGDWDYHPMIRVGEHFISLWVNGFKVAAPNAQRAYAGDRGRRISDLPWTH